jgi:hypothetical protein
VGTNGRKTKKIIIYSLRTCGANQMSLYKRGGIWWYEFVIVGKRVRKSSHSSKKTIARQAMDQYRDSLERALAGMPAAVTE